MELIMKYILTILLFTALNATAQRGYFAAPNTKATTAAKPTVQWAQWSTILRSFNVYVLDGNLTAYRNGGTGTVLSTIGKSTGKWYAEMTLTTAGNMVLGVAKSIASLSLVCGGDVNGYGMFVDDGTKLNNGPVGAYGSACSNGDIIGVALNMDDGEITLYKNNVSWGVMFTGLSGTFYFAYSSESIQSQCRANFGETAFTYTPPTGYTGLFNNL